MSSDAKKRRAAARAREPALARSPRRALPLLDTPSRVAFRARVAELTSLAPRNDALPAALGAAAEDTAQFHLDAAFAALPRKPACAAGCAFCCHVYVSATVPEVAALLAHVRRTLPADALAALAQRLRVLSDVLKGTTPETYPGVACAFLRDGACIGYAARPLACRSHHSFDLGACQEAYQRGEGAVPSAAAILDLQAELKAGYRDVLAERALDDTSYELQQLARILLEDATAVRRSLDGEAGVFDPTRGARPEA